MEKNEAMLLLKENLKKDYMVKHCLAVATIMKKTAEYLNEDEETWEKLGLLHDIDFEKYNEPEKHTLGAREILGDKISDEIHRAILSHNFENTNIMPKTRMEFALIAADAISGLVIACALVMPSKRLGDVKLRTVKEKFKSKDFARNCNREKILYCEKIGIEREKFFEIALDALQGIANDLGL